MSQTKVQLIAPIGVVTATTLETTGVLTATTFVGDIAGTVTGITSTTDNLDVGILTATAFVGDFTGTASSIVTGSNVTAGIITGTKFIGNATGTVSGLADDTNINVGVLTSTSFVGDLTGNAAGLSTTTANLSLGIVTATSFAGNITGNAAGISVTTTNVTLGIITASAFHGDATNMTGVSGGPVGQQAVTANSGTTTIDLSSGNLIYMTQSANTTVSFANTEGNTDVVYLVRVKDATSTERTITWPSGFVWDGGTEPTLLSINDTGEGQVFKLTTRDNGATWYGAEIYSNPGGFQLWGWGSNGYGTLGVNDIKGRSSPVQVPSAGWTSIKTQSASNSIAAVKNDGTLWSWGYNLYGGLGQNNQTRYSSPVQVPGTTWKHVSSGMVSMGVKTDNTLWVWGGNNEGALGQNDRTQRSSPVQVPGTTWDTNINSFGGNYAVSMAIKNDGTLWSWGYNNGQGNLGLNQPNTSRYSSPVQIPGTTWSQVIPNDHATMALKTDGTIWGWGINDTGGLGQNGTVKVSSPIQIGDKTNWVSISNGSRVKAAVNTSGELWAWGMNEEGQLGQNNVIYYSSPIQIPGTNWAHCNLGDGLQGKRILASKTDGTLWTWGDGMQGQMGNSTAGNNSHYSSPIQIPGTGWNTTRQSITNNAYDQFALKS